MFCACVCGGATAAPTDLHAITGYDYLSCAQWDAMLEQLLARIALPAEGIRFLDAGCGSGAVSDWAMRHYGARIAAVRYDTHTRASPSASTSIRNHSLSLSLAQAYGFDLTPALLEVAQARVQGPVFWTGDICEPASYAPVPAASLDLIVCFGVFIHLRSHAHAEQAMRNMYGTLKPGGTLFIGYNMDAYNRQEAEASRQKSQRYVPQSAAGRSVLDSLTARSLPAARSSRSCSAPCRRTSTAATSLCVLLLACLLACSLAWPN